MSRWTWKDDAFKGVAEDKVELEMTRREPAINMVADQLASLREEREQRSFHRQAQEEAGESDEPEFDTDEEQAAYTLRQETQAALERAHETALEEQLDKLGARMCRPYEHWNEAERLMEYLERDRDC